MWNLFNQIYRAPILIIRAIIANPIGIFIYCIIANWYFIVMVPAVIVTFWVFKGLEKSGVLDIAQKNITQHLNETKAVAKYCTPLILDLKALWHCIENTPKYEADEDEKDLQQKADTILKNLAPKKSRQFPENPYSKEEE